MKKIKNKSGFSFIEVLVATFIFVLIIVAVSMTFASLFGGYKGAKSIQKDLENAQYAMNLMAKSLRTSSIISPDSVNNNATDVTIYNYSKLSGKCERFKFDSVNKKIKYGYSNNAAVDSDKTLCTSSTISNSSLTDMASDSINNAVFSITPSDGDSNPKIVGKVTISIEVKSGSDKARIQSTVSLRDYSETMP
jgi:Tfp pilus assembly protein PilW